VPVYGVLVPEESAGASAYVINITRQLLLSNVPQDQDTATLRSDSVWKSGNKDSIQSFLSDVVPYDTALVSFNLGMCAKIPKLQPSYEIFFPLVPIDRFLQTILAQIRRTAANSILSFQKFGGLDTHIEARRRFASILERYCEDPNPDDHWETQMALGLSNHSGGKFKDAITEYEAARRSIQSDSNIRKTEPPWSVHLERLNENIERASQQLPLGPLST